MASAVVSVIRNKLLAVTLGTAGVGVFAQLLGFQNLAAGLVPLGMQAGAVHYLARLRGKDPGKMATYARTAQMLFGGMAIVTTLGSLAALAPLASWALDDPTLAYLLIPAVLGIPFLVQTSLWQCYLQANLDVAGFSRSLVWTSALGLAALVPLVLGWGLTGAAFSLLLGAGLGYAATLWYGRKSFSAEQRQQIRTQAFSGPAARDMFVFAAANLPVFGLALLVPFLVRTELVRALGLPANGFYQVAFAISSQILVIPLSAINTYSFPKISQAPDLATTNREIVAALHTALLFTTVGILTVLLAREWAVRLLFSREFLPASSLLPAQLAGDFLRSIAFVLALPLLPMRRFLARAVLAAIQSAIFMGAFYWAPTDLKLRAAVLAYAGSWLLAAVLHFLYLRSVSGFEFGPFLRRLIFVSALAVLLLALNPMSSPTEVILGSLVYVTWLAVAVRRSDVQAALSLVKNRLYGAATE